MTRSTLLRSLPLALALAVQACQATGLLAVRADASAKPASVKPSAAIAASAAPASAPSAGASGVPLAIAPAPLAAAPDTVILRGTIKLDASYAVSAGGARVVANQGAVAVAFADAGLIANNTANLIANNGGGVLAQWGAGIIANNGGTMTTVGSGGTLISDKGSGLMTGGNNGTLISDNGAAFTLLQVPAIPLYGAILPAAGMLVGVVDLRSGELRPIGQDATGKPAYAVYSDSAGGYALHLPAELSANVAVVAVPPASPKIDLRLSFDLVTAPRGEAAAIDEDTALASRFMRDFLRGNIARALSAANAEGITIKTTAIGPELKAVIEAFFSEVNAESRASGLQQAPAAEIARVAARVSDTVLAHVDLPAILTSPVLSPRWTEPPAPALAVMVDVLRLAREKATAALRLDPDFAAKQPYLITANAELPEAERYVIAKPADFGDFIVKEYLLTARRPAEGIDEVFTSLGAGEKLEDGANTQRLGIEAGVLAISGGIVGAVIVNQGGAHDEAIALVSGWKPVAAAAP